MSMAIENIDLSSEIISNPEYIDASLYFAAEATVARGTILARKVVADAVVAAAVAGGTGNGTVTAASVAAGQVIPMAGAYTLVCVTAVTNGGIFKLVDPNGAIVATDIKMTAGAGTATVVETAGLLFTITDGSTDFVAGDSFTLTVAAEDYYVPYASAGAGGAQVPSALLTSAVYKATAGTVPVRVAVRGNLRKDKLIIAADGNSTNVNSNVIDGLRRFGFLVEKVTNRSVLDNQ